jgi:hypothetical protein
MHSTINFNKGDKFGYLTFTGNKKSVGEGRSRRYHGEFICDCGRTAYIRMDGVRRGNNKSCGCKSPNLNYKEKREEIGEDYPFHVLLNLYKKNAKARGILFELTISDLKDQFNKQDGKCCYTGQDMTVPANFLRIFDPEIASIDRINPDMGYIQSNIQLTTKKINFMKYRMSHEEFISTCHLIVERCPTSS